MAEEEGRAAIWEIDRATGAKRLFATGLRNPNGMDWEPVTGMLWTAVNERDELGSDLVPDYMTSVRRRRLLRLALFLLRPPRRHAGQAAAARPRRLGARPRLCARPAHRLARARFLSRRPARPSLCRGRLRRPARLVEPQAGERLQGDLRPVRGRPAGGRGGRRSSPASSIPTARRAGGRSESRSTGRAPCSSPTTSATPSGGSRPRAELVGGPFLAHHGAMRLIFPLLLLLASAAVPAKPAPPPPAHDGPFLSPMGEPFRSARLAADNVGAWFAAADRDSDRAVTLAEVREDAERFFARLDTDRDGELEMAEIARYENEVAPEVQVGLQMRSTGVGDWRGGRQRRDPRLRKRAGRRRPLLLPQHPPSGDGGRLRHEPGRLPRGVRSGRGPAFRPARQGSRRPPRPRRAAAPAPAAQPPAGPRQRQSVHEADGHPQQSAGPEAKSTSAARSREPQLREGRERSKR